MSNSSSTLSEKTQNLFQQIEEERKRESKFIKLQSGETRVVQFNAEKFQIAETEFEGKISKRVHYSVLDSKHPLEGEKILSMSLTNAISINALLKKGLNLLEVKRIGDGRNTSIDLEANVKIAYPTSAGRL